MSPMSNQDLSEKIGELRGDLRGVMKDLQDGLDAMRSSLEKSETRSEQREQRAAEARSRLYEKMDDVNARVARLENDALALRDEILADRKAVADMKPTIDEFNSWKQRGVGALFVIGLGGTAFGAALILTAESFLAWVKHRFGF